MKRWTHSVLVVAALAVVPVPSAAQQARKPAPDPRLERLKAEALTKVAARADLVQQIIDHVFSFGELGMQEFETSKYLTGVLEQNGFKVERGTAGMPTAWVATWGSGKPVIALGSDIDGIPQSNQKPAVGYRDPLVAQAPGHGEGHNSGQAVNIVAAIAVKEIMEREKIPGTLKLWPGVAEEAVAGKAHLIRAGVFKDVDVTLFTHVANNLAVSWGQSGSNALVSVLFVPRADGAFGGSTVAREVGAGRGDADGAGMGVQARAPRGGAAVALCDPGRRRSA